MIPVPAMATCHRASSPPNKPMVSDREFGQARHLQVRRRIIPGLCLDPEAYSEDLRPLVRRANEIARSHGDEFIRHRVEVQLGAGGPYMAIPDTEAIE